MQDEPARSYSIPYEATISSTTLWWSADGKECEYVFTLSDGTRWMTRSAEHFQSVTQARWSDGDHLLITLTEDCWLVQNLKPGTKYPFFNSAIKQPNNLSFLSEYFF